MVVDAYYIPYMETDTLPNSKILYKGKQLQIWQMWAALLIVLHIVHAYRIPFYPQKDLSLDDKFCGLPSYDIHDGGNFTFFHFPSSLRFN